ncbi:MAG: 50S ribosomal protein L24 [bacterium]
MKIKKGDTVRIIAGKDIGREGKVVSVLPARRRVTVEDLNLMKKATRPDPKSQSQGGIVPMPASMDVSNVMLVCPRCNKPSRVSMRRDGEGRPHRRCRKCKELIGE